MPPNEYATDLHSRGLLRNCASFCPSGPLVPPPRHIIGCESGDCPFPRVV